MNAPSTRNFFSRRWRGEVPLRTVFWRDLIGVGTTVNMLATFVALVAASQGASAWAVASIHFASLPYNIFLVSAVGRGLAAALLSSPRLFGWP